MRFPHKNHPGHSLTSAQSLIEIAMLLPILLLLIIGAMDFGRMVYTKMVITNAARAGANYFATSNTCKTGCVKSTCYEGIATVARLAGTSSGVVGSDLVITQIPVNSCGTSGSSSSVTVTKSADFIFGGFLKAIGLIDGPLSLSSTVTMVVQ
jgi:Flp pilus assembly protein TadG